MMATATRLREAKSDPRILHLAFELSNSTWKLAFTTGLGQKSRERQIAARDLEGLRREIDRAKQRFGLAQQARVVSCYEAGRDGTDSGCTGLWRARASGT
jgi:hypothetical protein